MDSNLCDTDSSMSVNGRIIHIRRDLQRSQVLNCYSVQVISVKTERIKKLFFSMIHEFE